MCSQVQLANFTHSSVVIRFLLDEIEKTSSLAAPNVATVRRALPSTSRSSVPLEGAVTSDDPWQGPFHFCYSTYMDFRDLPLLLPL